MEPMAYNFSRWFLFRKQHILLNGNGRIPAFGDIRPFHSDLTDPLPIGRIGDHPCYAAKLPPDINLSLPFEFKNLRSLLGRMDDHFFAMAGLAFQLVRWNKLHQYCNRCGASLALQEDEHAKICSHCQHLDYPRIHPCIIVAIYRDNQILLARPKRMKRALYSVIAGYVEPGETLEDAVQREIKEEVSLEVNNIRYFGSQSWPFSNALMVAFTAEYKNGMVTPDMSEIGKAGWYSADSLPPIPPRGSISRKLIDAFVAGTIHP
jgi:NAD+ diphosphatase